MEEWLRLSANLASILTSIIAAGLYCLLGEQAIKAYATRKLSEG